MSKLIPLSELGLGVPATVETMNVEGTVNQRLMAFGLAPGSGVVINHVAPFGDPISLSFGAQCVMVRRRDAENIIVKPIAKDLK